MVLRWGGRGARFPHPSRPALELLYKGYRVFPGGKATGALRWPPTPISRAEFKERVELYLCSPSGSWWPALWWTLPYVFTKPLAEDLWPRNLRRGSAAACLLGLGVRIPPGHRCLSLVSVVCCQVEGSATGRSLVQRSPTECVSLNVINCNNNALHLQWVGRRGQNKNSMKNNQLTNKKKRQRLFNVKSKWHIL